MYIYLDKHYFCYIIHVYSHIHVVLIFQFAEEAPAVNSLSLEEIHDMWTKTHILYFLDKSREFSSGVNELRRSCK